MFAGILHLMVNHTAALWRVRDWVAKDWRLVRRRPTGLEMAQNRNPADAKFIASRAWRDHIRPAQLRRQPLCEDCKAEGKTTTATTVDHVVVPNGDPPLQRSPSNLKSLCDSHHSHKTRSQDRGYSNEIDPMTGFFTDPRHPSNRLSAATRAATKQS
jgi:hypothetical protein